jgi:hypothetical protein
MSLLFAKGLAAQRILTYIIERIHNIQEYSITGKGRVLLTASNNNQITGVIVRLAS